MGSDPGAGDARAADAAAYSVIPEQLRERIERLGRETVQIVPYDPNWPEVFRDERCRLLERFPVIVRRVEHFGSTAVPGLSAKPIVDMLVEVTSLDETTAQIVPALEADGYDYLWRPTSGDDTPPFYAWFIKRNPAGQRTHHIHMVERDFPQWEALLFRDYLIANPEAAQQYLNVKQRLAAQFPNDREAYTDGKGEFVRRITDIARATCAS
jgi:GrpB-like predicted nucleotidyltransferase (UPF0157 family)